MNKDLFGVMDNLSQGILILDSGCGVVFANAPFLKIFKLKSTDILHRTIFDVLPGFDRPCYVQIFAEALKNGYHFFLSAAVHKDLLACKERLNIRISHRVSGNKKYLLLEFIDVTAEFIRIRQLKENINRLSQLNQQLIEKEKVIQDLAYYDSLTGVANRTLFYELAKKMLQTAERNHELLGLMFIDVDKFKNINDTFGHEMGDSVLCQVAKILTGSTRKNDVVSRYGGDEFLVLLPQIREKKNYLVVANKIFGHMNSAVCQNGVCIHVSFSIGVSFYPQDGFTIDTLIAKADRAMYAAKQRRGSRRICAFNQSPVDVTL